MRTARGHRGEAGFTVVEMLVSLIVLALIMSFMPGALRLSTRVWERDAGLARTEGMAAFLRASEDRIAETKAIFARDKAEEMRVEFTGESARLAFVAPSPGGPAGGGVYRFELFQGVDGAISLRQTLYRVGTAADAPLPASVHVAPARGGRLSFRYFGARETGTPAAWHARWPRRDALPDLVEISVMGADGAGLVHRRAVELRLRPPRE